jgi:capsular exopolysaccharide synthesis family protein
VEPIDYLSGLRRRAWIIIGMVGVGILVGWLTRSIALGTSTPKEYEAGAAVLGSTDPTVTNLSTLSALTTIGPVPGRVAKDMKYQGDPADLAGDISTSPDQGSGVLWIIARAPTPGQAESLSNTFARELVRYVVESRAKGSLAQAKWLRGQMNRLAQDITELDAKIGTASPASAGLLTAERDAKIQNYGFLVGQYQQVTAASFEPSSIQIIQKARANPVTTTSALLGSVTLTKRLAVAGALGLLAGLVLALVLERFDTRIRTRGGAERSFGLPVLAEIPPLRRGTRGAIVKANGELARGAQPLRLLGALLVQGGSTHIGLADNGNGRRPAQSILVTSASAAEGKTSVVARLAMAYSENGKRVLVLSCDFRRPDVHRLFGVSNQPGLSDALTSSDQQGFLEHYAQSTALRNVKVVPSGPIPANPGRLLNSKRMRQILEEAREAADVVLVDTTPLLANGDAAYLLQEVDCVLVVARTGSTTVEEAKRIAEVLGRLDAPVAGVALNGNKG